MIGRAPQTVDAQTLGEALDGLDIDTDQTTFRANGVQVGLDYAPTEAVTVVGAKNLVGA
jgi:hypothetical protein